MRPGRGSWGQGLGPAEGSEGGGSSFPLGEAVAAVRDRIQGTPDIFLVLGSGLSSLAGEIADAVTIPYGEIPGFPEPTVEGHEGHLVSGRIGATKVLLQAGRFHYYEGHPGSVVGAPIRVAYHLGAQVAILTNAAGSLDPELVPGSLLLLDDHINFMARSPLAGPVVDGEERFPDLSAPYDPDLQELVMKVAAQLETQVHRGTYVSVLGPSYETPAEIRFLASTGAKAVGMSTVPEAIIARALGMRVLAFSLLTNMAAGLSTGPLDHAEVLAMGQQAGARLRSLLKAVVTRI